MKTDLEICCPDIESVLNAQKGGADRIELCASLETGGLTPSAALIRKAVEIFGPGKVHVLIRPRNGDFVYSEAEKEIIIHDIEEAVSAGAGGIVVGALLRCGSIDAAFSAMVRKKFPHVKLTFHRAFDLVSDPFHALEEIISLGYDYILTSGQKPDAVTGALTIGRLVGQAADRIRIMAAAGVTPDNITDIIKITGVKDVHASAKERIAGCLEAASDVSMGTFDDDYSRFVASPLIVACLKNRINEML